MVCKTVSKVIAFEMKNVKKMFYSAEFQKKAKNLHIDNIKTTGVVGEPFVVNTTHKGLVLYSGGKSDYQLVAQMNTEDEKYVFIIRMKQTVSISSETMVEISVIGSNDTTVMVIKESMKIVLQSLSDSFKEAPVAKKKAGRPAGSVGKKKEVVEKKEIPVSVKKAGRPAKVVDKKAITAEKFEKTFPVKKAGRPAGSVGKKKSVVVKEPVKAQEKSLPVNKNINEEIKTSVTPDDANSDPNMMTMVGELPLAMYKPRKKEE